MDIQHHFGDLPDTVTFRGAVAVDTETMGLNLHRDRLCVVQLSGGDGVCHVVQMKGRYNPDPGSCFGSWVYDAPHLQKILSDRDLVKIFHFGRFDIAALYHFLGVSVEPVYCTKIASKLVRTFTDRHGLKDLCRDLLGVDISKEQQTSDWGSPTLTPEQLKYAATDVLYLHQLKTLLDARLVREGRQHLAQACFDFLPTCAKMDLSVGEQKSLSLFDH